MKTYSGSGKKTPRTGENNDFKRQFLDSSPYGQEGMNAV